MVRTLRWGNACALAAVLLAACGGGGGSGGDGFTLSPSSLRFEAERNGARPATQVVEARITDSAVALILAGFPTDEEVPSWLTVTDVDTSVDPVRISVAVTDTSLAAGTYRSRLRIATGREDETLIGYQDLPVTYVVKGVLEVAPGSLAFGQVYGGPAPAARTLALTDNGGGSYAWTAAVASDPSGFLRVAGATQASGATLPASLAVTVQSSALPGSYTASVSIAGGTGRQVVVPVTYTITAPELRFSLETPSFSIDRASTAAALQQALTVGSTGAALTWSVTSSVPWLTVVPSSGVSGDAVAVTLLPEQLEAVPDGAHEATLTFSYAGTALPARTATLPVTLELALPTVLRVAPHVIAPGVQDEVVIRGAELTGLAADDLRFGTAPAASLTVVSDTELVAAPPALAAGNYRVQISNALGIDRSTAALAVVAPVAYPAASLPYPQAASHIVRRLSYDDERHALVVSLYHSGVARYAYAGGAWGEPTSASDGALEDAVLSLDGTKVLSVSDNTVRQLDPVTLATGPVAVAPFPAGDFYFSGIAEANDGVAVLMSDSRMTSGWTEGYLYAVDASTISDAHHQFYQGNAGASGDGSWVVICEPGLSPGLEDHFYDPSSGSFVPSGVSATFLDIAFDRKGTRAVLDHLRVYDGSLAMVGVLPYTTIGATVSPDGRRIYTLDATRVLHSFEVTTAGAIAEIGTGTALTADPGDNVEMVMTGDGSTIFLAGRTRIVVAPAP